MSENQTDDDLKDLWQDTAPVDVDALVANVKAERRKLVIGVWCDLLAGVASTCFLIWAFRRGGLGLNPVVPWVLIATIVIYTWWVITLRNGLWKAASEKPLDLLKLQLGRAKLGVKMGQLCYLGATIGAGIGFIVGRYIKPDDYESPFSDPVRYVILMVLISILVFFVVYGVRLERKKKAEVIEINQMIADIRDNE